MVYVLHQTTKHFDDQTFLDAKVRDFGNLKAIRKSLLTSKKIDITGMKFNADLLIENIEDRACLINNMSWPIYSPEMMEVLSKFDISYPQFPIHLFSVDNNQLPISYTALQIPRTKDLVDLEQSVYTTRERFPDFFHMVEKLVLNLPDNCEQIFRIYEKFSIVLVREKLKNAIEEAGLKGIKFIPAEEYSSTVIY